jgi:hypothetical protein
MYHVSHLHLLEHQLGLNTLSERDAFEFKIKSLLEGENFCNESVSFNLNKCNLFFDREPTLDLSTLIGIIHLEGHYIHALCSNGSGRRILHEFVFPKIALDDFESKIRLEPLYTAIVFYLKMGFKFEDERNQCFFEKLMSHYQENEITQAMWDILNNEEEEEGNSKLHDKLKVHLSYMERDGMNEMYWDRLAKYKCSVCRDPNTFNLCNICFRPICGDICLKIHKCKNGKG